MSTRSGKRIHVSPHENTLKSNTKSERKTRSKHLKENSGESNASPKLKKRNYVAYPTEDGSGSSVVNNKEEGRTTRAHRKNALKEHNCALPIESVDSAEDSRKPVRTTRRTLKSESTEEVTTVEPVKQNGHNIKKGKKKKKVAQKVAETVSKKKLKKKKKGRRSSSIVAEDIEPASSGLNKSNMSVDSFHSATGSPRDLNIMNNSTESTASDETETRQIRSAAKPAHTFTSDHHKDPRKRRSIVNSNSSMKAIENDNLDNTLTKQLKKCRSSLNELVRISLEGANNCKNSTFDVDSLYSKNATLDKTMTPAKNIETSEVKVKVSASKGQKRKCFVDEVEADISKPVENVQNTTFEKDDTTLTHKNKKRKSTINGNISVTPKSSPSKSNNDSQRKSIINTTFEKEKPVDKNTKNSIIDATFDVKNSAHESSPSLCTTQDKHLPVVNITFEKDSETSSDVETIGKKISDSTFDVIERSSPFKLANEVSSPIKTAFEKDIDTEIKGKEKRKSINTTFDKDDQDLTINTTFEKVTSKTEDEIKHMRKSLLRLSSQVMHTEIENILDSDQEKKLDITFDKCSKSSLISSDNSMITLDKSEASRISITDDESQNEENIVNTTPVLIESSIDESRTITPHKKSPHPKTAPITPLKREGTFTKDEPEVTNSPKLTTPAKRMSLPSAGFTPFHVNKSSSKEKSVMNVTRSIEKSRRSSLVEPVPRTTKVMFCSPINNPAAVIQQRKTVIKSNLKGSNKSFVFDDSASQPRAARKRSYTQSVAEEARAKRSRLATDLQQSVDRLSRPRTASASAKVPEPTTPSKKPVTPSKKDKGRTKLPNFAALHQKEFAKMESLDECQERKARRAKQLLTPTGAVNVLDRVSPKDKDTEPEKPSAAPKKPDTPVKSLPTLRSLNSGFTRFGFKLNLDVNPFSIPSKKQIQPKENKPNRLTEPGLARKKLPVAKPIPSKTGATSVRRDVAKQTIMREKSFTDRRNVTRTENRTVIKGVRTNRRFELQMKMREL